MNLQGRLPRRASVVVLAMIAMATVLGLVPVDVGGVPAAVPASAKGTGQQPLDDILYWADQRKACGLSRDQLAAMMMAPTYPETGASGEVAPSPMTLSRWDTQSALYAFGDKATPYQRAFWHPGVGMWQFDSAGFWDLTAADAISTSSSAREAATVIAQRFCTGGTRKYAWGPWYGCATGTICEDIYNTIFDGTRLRNLTIYGGVTRDGGMEARACTLGGTVVACHFVDPARAQGFAGWAIPGAGPTPVSAPFYVVRANGREYRIWLKEDTGYGVTITADKPVKSNARTSLVWSTAGGLCDMSTARGQCGGGPRIAVTPWGNRWGNPFGSVDSGTGGNGSTIVNGWVIDPDTSASIDVHVYVDGKWGGLAKADRSRPDVAAAVPGYGVAHGFQVTTPGLSGGQHEVCVYAINVGPYGDTNPLVGCRTITVTGNPFGSIDGSRMGPGGLFVQGWAIDPDTTGAIGVHVYVDGRWGGLGTTDLDRPDVAAAYPWWGTSRGYSILAPMHPGAHNVCAYGINVSTGTTNSSLGCRTLVAPDATPTGSYDGIQRVTGGVRVSGWTLDPSTADPVQIHVYVDGRWGGAFTANSSRLDVGAAFPGFGPAHGFDVNLALGPAAANVCVYAINVGPGLTNPLIGCRTA